MYYIWLRPTAYGWHFSNANDSIFHYYYGYSKKEAIKKFREDYQLKHKKIHFFN